MCGALLLTIVVVVAPDAARATGLSPTAVITANDVAVQGGSGKDATLAVTSTTDGGTVAVGSVAGPATVAGIPIAAPSPAGFVAKLGADGQAVWVRTVTGTSTPHLAAVAPLPDGGVVVAGRVTSVSDFSSTNPGSAQRLGGAGMVGVLANYDDDGRLRWVRVVTGAGVSSFDGLAVTPDGSVRIAGTVAGPLSINDGSVTVPLHATTLQTFVAGFRADGTVEWATLGTGPSIATGLTLDAAGNVFSTGYFVNTLRLRTTPPAPEATGVSPGTLTSFVARYTPSGDPAWVRPLGTAAMIAAGISSDPASGRLAITGALGGPSRFGPEGTAAVVPIGSTDAVVVVIAGSDGSWVWNQRIGGAGGSRGNAVQFAPNGHLLVAGSTTSNVTVGEPAQATLSRRGGFVMELAADGSHRWHRQLLGGTINDVDAPADGTVRIAGTTSAWGALSSGRSFVKLPAQGGMDGVTATFAVGEDHPPVARNGSAQVQLGRSVPVTLQGDDADGDPITYSVVDQPTKGTLTGVAPNLVYTATGGATGPDTFTFRVDDAYDAGSTATVTITVVAGNHPPTATPLPRSLAPGAATPLTLAGTDPDHDTLSFRVDTTPAHGTLTGVAPNLMYTPHAGYRGTDRFEFTVDDGHGGTDTAAVTLAVKPPNVVYILDDDQRYDQQRFLTKTNALLGAEGTTFTNAVVSYAECCPSRASLLTGQYAHNHGVVSSGPPTGGVSAFDDTASLASWLSNAGYYTAIAGKYLNGYGVDVPSSYVPPGWDDWFVPLDPGTYAYLDYDVSDNGVVRHYGTDPQDYSTDVFAERAASVIRAQGNTAQPFFVLFTPVGPHSTWGLYSPIPAARHLGLHSDERAPRPPSFDEADVADKPAAIRRRDPISAFKASAIDTTYRDQAESLLAIDDAVEGIYNTLRDTGELENTIIVFTSDNGLHLGEHRLAFNKATPYEEAVHVPFIIRGPGVPSGAVRTQPVANIDAAPTILQATGTATTLVADGTPLQPFLADPTFGANRSILLENGPYRGRTLYAGVRDSRYTYIRYSTGESELYDRLTDPFQLTNLARDPAQSLRVLALDARLQTLKACAGTTCRMGY